LRSALAAIKSGTTQLVLPQTLNEHALMKSLPTRWVALIAGISACVFVACAALSGPREFRVYPSLEPEADVPLPDNYQQPGEFVVGRLMYPQSFGFTRWGFDDWRQGGTAWAVDYPRGDRQYAKMLHRLTRISTRSVEQPINLDDGDDVFYWPFLVAGLPGMWDLSDAQATKLREYLLRGGFLLCDSFFGTREWTGFVAGIKRVFPDRPIIDLPDDHPIFHTVYDLSSKKQVGNMQAWQGRGVGYRSDGAQPHWRAILDDHERVMVLISFNNDLGDGWQWADNPQYPIDEANFAIRMSVNIAVYAMTH
jgi:hypothetical protein